MKNCPGGHVSADLGFTNSPSFAYGILSRHDGIPSCPEGVLQQYDRPNAGKGSGNGKCSHDPLSVGVFSGIKLAKAGYDWRVFLGIAAFWVGGLVLSYFMARVVSRRGLKQSDKADREQE